MDFLLASSLLALAAGPLLFRLGRSSQFAFAGMDGFVRVAVAGLLLFQVLPWAMGHGGWLAAPLFAVGVFLPAVLHRLISAPTKGPSWELVLASFALTLHAFLDGAALNSHASVSDAVPHLALAVLLHRLPVAIALWLLIRPHFGLRPACLLLGTMAVATIAGHGYSGPFLQGSGTSWLAFFQSFMAGILLHVVLGHSFLPALQQTKPSHFAASALGGVLGGALLFGLGDFHSSSDGNGPAEVFLRLARASAPALLAASLTIAAVKAFLPSGLRGFFHGKNSLSQALRGTVAGLPVPICSCGVVPMYRSLAQAGTPPPAALAFLVAAPEVGWAAILLSLGLLGPELTVARLAAAALLALVVGMVVGRMIPSPTPPKASEQEEAIPIPQRIHQGVRYGFRDVVDDTAPWILVGLILSAWLEPALSGEVLLGLPRGLDVVLATLIGMPLYVCASGSTPLAAVLLAGGLSPGAAIAFLLTGPATNVTTAGLLSGLHGRKVAIAFGACMLLAAIAVGLFCNAVLGNVAIIATPHLHDQGSTLENASLLGLIGLYLASLFRLGVPGFLSRVFRPHDDPEMDHDSLSEDPSPPDSHSCCSP